MNSVISADQCLRVDLLSWVSYPYNGKSCYIYPRYIYSEGKFSEVDDEAFPDRGSFQAIVSLPTGMRVSDLGDRFGQLVVAHVDAMNFPVNQFYPDEGNPNKYQVQIDSSGRGPELTIKPFGEAHLSEKLVQVIDIVTSEPFTKPFAQPVEYLGSRDSLFCKEVLVRFTSRTGECYYGPFVYNIKQDGNLELSATKAYDYRIVQLWDIPSDSQISIRKMRDWDDETSLCTFIEKSWLESVFANSDENSSIDWIPDELLYESFNRVINASEEFKGYGGNALQNLKAAVRSYSNIDEIPLLDEPRKQRLFDRVSSIESLSHDADELIHKAAESIDYERLASLILSEESYPVFQDRLLASSGVQKKIEEEKQRLRAESDEAERRLDAVLDEVKKAENKLEAAEERATLAKQKADQLQAEVLGQKKEDLARLDAEMETKRAEFEAEITERQATLETMRNEYERAIVDKNRIDDDINAIINRLDDAVASSSKILENEILKKVVRKVNGVDMGSDPASMPSMHFATRESEEEMNPCEVVDEIVDSVTQRYGRDMKRKSVINLMICLMQGYITTFAGLPGTGKTSLCNILASSLGLLSDENPAPRFLEINVENGWTSYKDYIGYWNPITKGYEQSNAEVYDAMRRLTSESNEGIPPFIFLLDEANLSSVEHYWSPFLRACDSFLESGATLSLGGSESWHLPAHMRFLATVNFDHTTEQLSPRFLDRSWVITLTPQEIIESGSPIPSPQKRLLPFSYNKLMDVFANSGDTIQDQQMASLYQKLLSVCHEKEFPISPRAQLMMRRYVATASQLMDVQLPSNQYAPLDFAFSQKVLPMIYGTREKFEGLIEELIENCQQLEISLATLKRMKKIGENDGFYQYFI